MHWKASIKLCRSGWWYWDTVSELRLLRPLDKFLTLFSRPSVDQGPVSCYHIIAASHQHSQLGLKSSLDIKLNSQSVRNIFNCQWQWSHILSLCCGLRSPHCTVQVSHAWPGDDHTHDTSSCHNSGEIIISQDNIHINTVAQYGQHLIIMSPLPPQFLQSNALRRRKHGKVDIETKFQTFW